MEVSIKFDLRRGEIKLIYTNSQLIFFENTIWPYLLNGNLSRVFVLIIFNAHKSNEV